jgi:protoporphyrin/coproporphyrin ferrochelatase
MHRHPAPCGAIWRNFSGIPAWWRFRVRPGRSAKSYGKVWTKDGSPLLVETLALRDGLKTRLDDKLLVAMGMRYGNPSISSAMDDLFNQGARKILVLPLYPQYAAATTASTFDALAKELCQRRWLPDLRFISHYHDFSPYIDACASRIRDHWQQHGKPDKLLLSYHGIPKHYLEQGDPYFCECQKTSRLLAERLGLGEAEVMTTFQSRFGREEWLRPYTDEILKSLPDQGFHHVQVFCPGFAVDCLETLEEIDVENRHYFLAAGGKEFSYIPALNSTDAHLDALAQLVEMNLRGWEEQGENLAQRVASACGMGAKN